MSRVEIEPGLFVCESGDVFGVASGKLVKKTLEITAKGYARISHKGKHLRVHRLVAAAFLPNPSSLPQVNHIDGDKLNNTKGNLEWVTNGQNMAHAISSGLAQSRPIQAHREGCGYWFPNLKSVKTMGFNPTSVSDVLSGRYKRHRKYEFSRLDNLSA